MTLMIVLAGSFIGIAAVTENSFAAVKHSKSDAIAWMESQVGKQLNPDGIYPGECVDLVLAYYDYLAGNHAEISGNAYDYTWNKVLDGFKRIPGGNPEPGDVVVSTEGEYGHVWLQGYNGQTFHSNNPAGNKVVRKFADKGCSNKVWGVIRPDFGVQIKRADMQIYSGGFYWDSPNEPISGYNVQLSTKSDFSSNVTVQTIKSAVTAAYFTKLKADTTYYVRCRYYITNNGVKKYSDWSDTYKAATYTTKGNLKGAKITCADRTYTGKSVKAKPVLEIGNKKLKENTDYKLSYSNNKNIGTAKITIKGNIKYFGTLSTTFRILPKGISKLSVTSGVGTLTATWKSKNTLKGQNKIKGYQIRYSKNKNMSGAKTKTIGDAKTTKLKIKGLSQGTTYYVQARTYKKIGTKAYCSKWSVAKKIATKKESFTFNSYGRKISSKKLQNSFNGIEGAWLSVGSDSITIYLFDTKKGPSGDKYGADKYWDLSSNYSDYRRGGWDYENKSKKYFWFSNFIKSSSYFHFSDFSRENSKHFTILKSEYSTWYAISEKAFNKFWKYKVSDWKNKKNRKAISNLPFQ